MLGRIKGGMRRGWQRMMTDGWMASPTQWTWVWVNSGSWWWTGRPGVLQFMGLQRVRHDWATKLNWTELNWTDSGRTDCFVKVIFASILYWELIFHLTRSHPIYENYSHFETQSRKSKQTKNFWSFLELHVENVGNVLCHTEIFRLDFKWARNKVVLCLALWGLELSVATDSLLLEHRN